MRGTTSPSPRALCAARTRERCAAFSAWALCVLSVPAGACNDPSQSGGAKAPSSVRSEVLDHETCDVTGDRVAPLDTNADGKPDLYRVFDRSAADKDAHEVCRVVDLNHDGRPDLYEYFDGSGAIRRREFCYDDTGVVNAIEVYQGGKLAERVYDTTGQHKIDTWDWFDPAAAVDAKTGRPAHPVRRERDLRGDGRVNQWWTWSGDILTIATDRNGDGQPDPDSVIVFGGDAGAAESPPAAASSEGGAPGVAPAPGEATAADGGVSDGARGANGANGTHS